jgi:two-component system KDP operon response regulator KdpE
MNYRREKPLVLVVDDHRQVLRFIEIGLKLHGLDVITATSGKQALEIIKTQHPDIMLLDIVMPEMDGFEVLERLQAFDHLPVIAFSASIANYEEALKSGANAFISKPFNIDELTDKIRALLDEQRTGTD